MEKVNSIDHLRSLIKGGVKNFRINLNFGMYSVKHITLDKDGKFNILNKIDNTRQSLNEEDLLDESKTNIGKAIRLGALYTC